MDTVDCLERIAQFQSSVLQNCWGEKVEMCPTTGQIMGRLVGLLSAVNSGIGETGKVTGGTASGILSEFELAFDRWRHARAPLARRAQILYRHSRPNEPVCREHSSDRLGLFAVPYADGYCTAAFPAVTRTVLERYRGSYGTVLRLYGRRILMRRRPPSFYIQNKHQDRFLHVVLGVVIERHLDFPLPRFPPLRTRAQGANDAPKLTPILSSSFAERTAAFAIIPGEATEKSVSGRDHGNFGRRHLGGGVAKDFQLVRHKTYCFRIVITERERMQITATGYKTGHSGAMVQRTA
ncbi:hypothetical protein B0H14DRAFT_2648864 [Mycena olivaceomarginata]|nr:hypothetical protein B0H14DRAFT_2648864 [Mycena olivaceomarginata]